MCIRDRLRIFCEEIVRQNRPLQIGLDGLDFYKEMTCKLEINDVANGRFLS